MKKTRVFAGVFALLMALVAMPMSQVSAATPTVPVTYATEGALIEAYEMEFGDRLNFNAAFSNPDCTSTGSATYTNENGLVLDGTTRWVWNNGSNSWFALGANTQAIAFTIQKEAEGSSNLTILLPYTDGYAERYLINGSETFVRNWTSFANGISTTQQLLDGRNGFMATEQRFMIVRVGEGHSHIFVENEIGNFVPFGAGVKVDDTTYVADANPVPGEYDQAAWYDSSMGKGVIFDNNGSGKVYVKDITLFETAPDASTPAAGTHDEILKRYGMEEAKSIDFMNNNFSSSEVSFSAASGGSVTYSAEDGAKINNGTLIWENNGKTDWLAFGEDVRAISFKAKIDYTVPSQTTLTITMPYTDSTHERWIMARSTSGGYFQRQVRATTSGATTTKTIDGSATFATADYQFLLIRTGDASMHLYYWNDAKQQWTVLGANGHDGSFMPQGGAAKGLRFNVSGAGNAYVKNVKFYTALTPADAPLEIRDGIGGDKIGDNAETATIPTKLQAFLYRGLSDDARLIVAGYNANDDLEKVEVKRKSELVENKYLFDATSDPDVKKVRFFLWDGFSDMDPLTGSKTVMIPLAQ